MRNYPCLKNQSKWSDVKGETSRKQNKNKNRRKPKNNTLQNKPNKPEA
jgi:hypothetical protein